MTIHKRLLAAAAGATLLVGAGAVTTAADAATKVPVYKNCTAMHAHYKHGVGRKGAHDKTTGKRVTNFYVSNAIYKANARLDRDKDGIACEKR